MTTGNRPRPISDLVSGLTKGVFGQKNALFGKMIADWAHIAGEDIAAVSIPLELKFARPPKGKEDSDARAAKKAAQAVLHLAVRPAHALEISYQKSLLIERLNIFFGYAAIKDIKFVQHSDIMNNNAAPKAVRTRPLTVAEEQKIDKLVSTVQESDLQTALKNLGKAIAARQDKDA